MTLDLNFLIPEVRDGLSDIPFDMLDDKLIYKDLLDAYDYILEIVHDEATERIIRRCTIRYGTFISYRNYTALAERRLGSMPQSSSIQLQTLLMQTFNCLSLISKFPLNPDLSMNTDQVHGVVLGSLSTSMVGE
jgi:hypothetical protein